MKNKFSTAFLITLIIILGIFSFVFSYIKAIEISPEELNALMGQNIGAFRVLTVSQGGTGASTFTAGECLYGNGTDAIYSGSCAAGSMTALPDTQIYVGNASNEATATSAITVLSSGNIGIGTISPITRTHVNSTDAVQLTISGPVNAAGETAGIDFKYNSGGGNIARILATTQSDGGGDIAFQTSANGAAAPASKMTILRGGNVGVGTSAPVYLLDVAGTLRSTGALTVGAYTLPNTDGTADYVLKTDGSGALTWQEDLNNVLGSTVTLFHWNEASNVAGYEMLVSYPNNGTEVTETGTSTAGSYGLIDPYISSTTDIMATEIRAGIWSFHYFADVDSSVGDTRLVAKVYERATTSVETEIFTATSSEMTTGLKEYDFNGVISSSRTFQTDSRIVVKVYAWTDSVVEKTVTFYYDGLDNYSHIVTNLDLGIEGYTRARSDETITGNWTFSSSLIASNLSVTTSALGTITSGTWQGTAISTQYGGTGQNFSSSNGMLFLNAGSMSAVATGTIAGNGLTFAGTVLNFDGGDSPAGELGGTWASPTVDAGIFDDEYIKITDYNATTTHDNLIYTPKQPNELCLHISTSTPDILGALPVAGATSSLTFMSVGATTTVLRIGSYKTNSGTAGLNINDGTNYIGYYNAGTTGLSSGSLSTNNVFTPHEYFKVDVNLSSNATNLDICMTVKKDYSGVTF